MLNKRKILEEKFEKAKARSRICDYFHRTSQHVQKAYKSYTYVYTHIYIHQSENICKNDLFLRFLIWFMVIVNVRDSYSFSRFTSNEEQKKHSIKETKCCRVRYEWEKKDVSVRCTQLKEKKIIYEKKVFFCCFTTSDEIIITTFSMVSDIAQDVKTHFEL